MAKFTKRIPFDSIPVFYLSDSGTPDNPDINPDIPSLPVISPSFSFDNGSIPGYGSTLPVTDIDFSFPAEDFKRVQAWFTGDFSHVTLPESATLKKNMTNAVLSALGSFISSATNRNLFTSPFMIGYRYRLFDNSLVYLNEPVVLVPSEKAPDLIITSYKIYEKSLHTEVTISHYPAKLMLSIPVPENAEEYKDIITSVEFFITRQSELYSSEAQVSGIRSMATDGVRERVWYYERYETDAIIAQAKAEERRAMAVAREQEMKALAQEMKAKVIEAEANIPLAMSEAFRSGNLGVMDYYRMKNIEADTQMRESIAKPAENSKKKTDKIG